MAVAVTTVVYVREEREMQGLTLKQTIKEPVNKIFIEQNSPEPKVKVFIPIYEPLEI